MELSRNSPDATKSTEGLNAQETVLTDQARIGEYNVPVLLAQLFPTTCVQEENVLPDNDLDSARDWSPTLLTDFEWRDFTWNRWRTIQV